MYEKYLLIGVCLVLLCDSLHAKQNQHTDQTDSRNEFWESNSAVKPSEMIDIDENPPMTDVYMGSGGQMDDDYSGAGVDDEDSEASGGPSEDDEDGALGSGAGMYKSPCQKLKAELDTHQVVGAYTPRCTDDGAFEKMQCYSSTRECWCVDEMGREIDGTKKVAPERPDCFNLLIAVPDRKPPKAKPEEPAEPKTSPSEPEEEEEEHQNSVESEEINNKIDNMPSETDTTVHIGTASPESNQVEMLESKGSHMIGSSAVMTQPGILAAIVGGAVVGLLCAVLLVMFIVYRMRKKDEGSYALDEPKRSPSLHTYSRATNREFYA